MVEVCHFQTIVEIPRRGCLPRIVFERLLCCWRNDENRRRTPKIRQKSPRALGTTCGTGGNGLSTVLKEVVGTLRRHLIPANLVPPPKFQTPFFIRVLGVKMTVVKTGYWSANAPAPFNSVQIVASETIGTPVRPTIVSIFSTALLRGCFLAGPSIRILLNFKDRPRFVGTVTQRVA